MWSQLPHILIFEISMAWIDGLKIYYCEIVSWSEEPKFLKFYCNETPSHSFSSSKYELLASYCCSNHWSGSTFKCAGGTFILDSQKLYWFQPADISLRIAHMSVNISGQSTELNAVVVRAPLVDMPGFPGQLTETVRSKNSRCRFWDW